MACTVFSRRTVRVNKYFVWFLVVVAHTLAVVVVYTLVAVLVVEAAVCTYAVGVQKLIVVLVAVVVAVLFSLVLLASRVHYLVLE